MTAKCMHSIGNPEASCGKHRPELKSGLLQWFAAELSFSGVPTREFTRLTRRADEHSGSRNLAEESIPLFMPPSSTSTWDAETAKCTASTPQLEKYCGVRSRGMVSTHLRPRPRTCSSS